MTADFINTTKELHEKKIPFAMAMIVNRVVPSSGKPGDKAVILADGTIVGWIGGGCTRGIVIKEATLAISEGKSRLVRISTDGVSENDPGRIHYNMTCQSGGMVEIYIEPVLPKPNIIIMGKSHVAMALNKIANAMDYSVTVASQGADNVMFPGVDQIVDGDLTTELVLPDTCIVVCTQGDNDAFALKQAISSNASYVAFVASRKKGQAVFHELRTDGVSFDRLKEIKSPAGIDINAKLPDEVAISILAQIIEHFRGGVASQVSQSASISNSDTRQQSQVDSDSRSPIVGDSKNMASNPAIYINPVCGIPVEKATAKHVIEYQEESVYFCCDGCKVQFEAQPEKFIPHPSGS